MSVHTKIFPVYKTMVTRGDKVNGKTMFSNDGLDCMYTPLHANYLNTAHDLVTPKFFPPTE